MANVAVFIGRFQPFHNGHKAVVDQALAEFDKVVIVIGSSLGPRTPRNPFTTIERAYMIRKTYPGERKLYFTHVQDSMYDETLWKETVLEKVSGITLETDSITLIGPKKDSHGYHFDMFPTWKRKEYTNSLIYASSIRSMFYRDIPIDLFVPPSVASLLSNFIKDNEYKYVQEWYSINQSNKMRWKDAPFPLCFVTVDACVKSCERILLVKRKYHPGKGLWALPGGFLNQDETVNQGIVRELKKETGLVLSESFDGIGMFDHPLRSERGRAITHVGYFNLDGWVPDVKGEDDACEATWFPLQNITRDMMFEDHYDIIQHFCKKD